MEILQQIASKVWKILETSKFYFIMHLPVLTQDLEQVVEKKREILEGRGKRQKEKSM